MSSNENSGELYLKIRRSSFYMIVGKLVTPIIGFLITIYIIRKLSVTEYGIYNILLAVMGYIGLFSSLGLPSIFQRYIPAFNEGKQISNLKKLITQGSLLRIILSALFVLFVIVFSNQVGRFFKIGDWSGYFKIFSLGIIFSLESSLLSTALTSLFLHKYFVISNTLYVVIRAALLYFLLKLGFGLNCLLIGEVVCYGILMIMFFCFYNFRFARLNKVNEKEVFPLKRLARYGGFSYFNEMGATILSVSTDFFVISVFLGPAAVGIYAFANRTMQMLSRWMPHNLVQEVIRPTFFTRYTQTHDNKELEKMFNFLTKFTAFFLFPLAVGTFVLGDKLIIYIFDPKYLSSLKILWIVAIFTALNSFMFPTGLVLQSIEKVQILLFSKIFAVYNLIADLLVVKTYGIIGIALVTGSAILFKNIFMYAFVRKYSGLAIDFKSLGIIAVNSLLIGLLLYLVRKMVVNIPSFILVIIIGVAVYFVIGYFNKTFSKDERKIINKILPKPFFNF